VHEIDREREKEETCPSNRKKGKSFLLRKGKKRKPPFKIVAQRGKKTRGRTLLQAHEDAFCPDRTRISSTERR